VQVTGNKPGEEEKTARPPTKLLFFFRTQNGTRLDGRRSLGDGEGKERLMGNYVKYGPKCLQASPFLAQVAAGVTKLSRNYLICHNRSTMQCRERFFPGSQAPPGNPYLPGSARYLSGILAYNGGGTSRSCIPRGSLATRSVARCFLDPEF
jgi:hypothetical protein